MLQPSAQQSGISRPPSLLAAGRLQASVGTDCMDQSVHGSEVVLIDDRNGRRMQQMRQEGYRDVAGWSTKRLIKYDKPLEYLEGLDSGLAIGPAGRRSVPHELLEFVSYLV